MKCATHCAICMIAFLFSVVTTAPRSVAQEPQTELATFGGGCYWCVEAIFQRLKGVHSVQSGFMGGRTRNPLYEQVLTGRTGHAEVVQIEYDPRVVSYDTLLEVFWKTHDPTTKNRQGPDLGTQYRSAVFFHSPEQASLAKRYKKELSRARVFSAPIVTVIVKAETFYAAPEKHNDYFNQNSDKAYCQTYIVPKLEKLKKVFADRLKPEDPVSQK